MNPDPYKIPTFQECRDEHNESQAPLIASLQEARLTARQEVQAEALKIERETVEYIQIALTHTQGKVDELWAEYAVEKARLTRNQRETIKTAKRSIPDPFKFVHYFRKDYIRYMEDSLSNLVDLEAQAQETFDRSVQTEEDERELKEAKAKIYAAKRTIKFNMR